MLLEDILDLSHKVDFDITVLLNDYLKFSSYKNEIDDNCLYKKFDKILALVNKNQISEFLILLWGYDFSYSLLFDYREVISNKIITDKNNIAFGAYFNLILEIINSDNEILNFLKPYIETNCEYIRNEVIVKNKFKLNNNTLIYIKNYINFYFTTNTENIVENFLETTLNDLNDCFIEKKVYNIEKIDVYFVSKILVELLEKENMAYCDIKFIETGGYSRVLLIGNKVFKIGIPRATHEMPNSKYLLQPFFRYQFLSGGSPYLCVELAPLIDTRLITRYDLYQLYLKFREEGKIWCDPKNDNIGRLYSSNIVFHEGAPIIFNPQMNGLSNESIDILGSEEVVLLDSDALYDENNLEVGSKITDLTKEFELKYQERKRI